MAELGYGEITDDVLNALQKPRAPFFFAVAFLPGSPGRVHSISMIVFGERWMHSPGPSAPIR